LSEAALAFAWVNSTMQADAQLIAAATGGIWQGRADIGVTAPYALFGQQASGDIITANAVRLWTGILMQIVAVGPTSQFVTLITIADRIDVLFNGDNVRNIALPGGGGILEAHREHEIAQDDPLVNGQAWSRLGGLYRIDLQGS
jgi:hypothetical protein